MTDARRDPSETLGRFRAPLEAALRQALAEGAAPLDHAARYVMGWEDEQGRVANAGGKRLRPLLCLFAAEATGGRPVEAMPAAVAIELIHNFSLVHDDIQDRDEERHGRPTAWKIWGQAQAINLGDYLFTRALNSLRALPDADTACLVTDIVTREVEAMIRGQWADLAFEARDQISPGEYLEMVEHKTGALIGASLEAGAVLGGATPPTVRALLRWGRLVGKAFQVRDDILGVWGDPAQTGKANTGDIVRRKKSLPILLGLEHESMAETLREAYAKPQMAISDARQIAGALEAHGIRRRCERLAADLLAEADGVLDAAGVADQRAEFLALGRYLVERQA